MVELYVRMHGLKEVATRIGVRTGRLRDICSRRLLPDPGTLHYFGLRKVKRDMYTSDVEGVV